jgi:DNA replication protein DnaC
MSEEKTAGEIAGGEPLGERAGFCKKHGKFISRGISIFRTEIWSKCPQCLDEAEKQAAKSENPGKEIKRFDRIPPERYLHETFSTYECKTEKQRQVVERLREYQGEKNIIIYGPPGTGKTHLLWALVKDNPAAQYWKLSDIIRRVKCSFAPTARESEEYILNELAGVKILIIDEIGRQIGSVFEAVFIFDLLDTRYNNYWPTILCSNLPLYGADSIAAYIGSAAMDRINENAVKINCDWGNYRKEKQLWRSGEK